MADFHDRSIRAAYFHILFSFAVIGAYAKSFVTLQCMSEVNGQYGQASVLECKISTSAEVKNPEITWVSWKINDVKEPLLHFNDGVLDAQSGYSLAQQSWATSMDVSLRINNTTLQHRGKYTCDVMVNGGSDRKQSTLRVTARYGAPTITAQTRDVLTCSASGGYPKGHLSWSCGDRNESAETEITQTDGGLFQLTSRLTLQDDICPEYSCMVFNEGGEEEELTTFAIPPKKIGQGSEKLQDLNNIVTPVVVIGSLIVGLLVLLLLCRRRQQRRQCNHPVMTWETADGGACMEDQEIADEEQDMA